MERIGLEDGARQPARRVTDALDADGDDLAAEAMHLRQSRCISGKAAACGGSQSGKVEANAKVKVKAKVEAKVQVEEK